MAESLIETERKLYHQSLINDGVLTVTNGIASNADKSEKQSIYIAASICKQLGAEETKAKLSGQTLGKKFEILTCEFIKSTFPKMQGLRPGDWTMASAKGNAGIHISSFSQYAHLADLTRLLNENPALGSSLGNMYIVAPDIIVARKPCPDSVLNQKMNIVGNEAAALSPLRAKNNSDPILHASISAKWTMRSDRAQNSRTEALSLIRDRKGALPHIMVVTGEPMPSRIASLALGTGDIDCVYHFALPELIMAVTEYGKTNDRNDVVEQLNVLIQGCRLRDISDMLLDLAI